jgi:hypothetical protein
VLVGACPASLVLKRYAGVCSAMPDVTR